MAGDGKPLYVSEDGTGSQVLLESSGVVKGYCATASQLGTGGDGTAWSCAEFTEC